MFRINIFFIMIICSDVFSFKKLQQKKKVAWKIKKLMNSTIENRRSYEPMHYQYQSAMEDPADVIRNLNLMSFLEGASITSHVSLHLPVPVCQFTDICKY